MAKYNSIIVVLLVAASVPMVPAIPGFSSLSSLKRNKQPTPPTVVNHVHNTNTNGQNQQGTEHGYPSAGYINEPIYHPQPGHVMRQDHHPVLPIAHSNHPSSTGAAASASAGGGVATASAAASGHNHGFGPSHNTLHPTPFGNHCAAPPCPNPVYQTGLNHQGFYDHPHTNYGVPHGRHGRHGRHSRHSRYGYDHGYDHGYGNGYGNYH